MIKKTLYFGNPAYLSSTNNQLVFSLPESKGVDKLFNRTVPIEDIGVVILDHSQITITQTLLNKLLDNNAVIVTCDSRHMPSGMMLSLEGNSLQQSKYKAQIEASTPLNKQLWQQTIKAKIKNQASLLRKIGIDSKKLDFLESQVKSGDSENHEGRAAAYYWSNLFPKDIQFKREKEGDAPNNILNYGYAILRATMARGLVSSGLLLTKGIFHRNQYNAYCLADDIMEPYRPFVDEMVNQLVRSGMPYQQLDSTIKKEMLGIPVLDVMIDGKRSPLMIAIQRTTSSLADCFEGTGRKILYPEFL